MYYNKEFVHQVGKKKNYHSIRMHGQQNTKIFPVGFPTKTLYAPLLSPIRVTCPYPLLIHLDLIAQIISVEEYNL